MTADNSRKKSRVEEAERNESIKLVEAIPPEQISEQDSLVLPAFLQVAPYESEECTDSSLSKDVIDLLPGSPILQSDIADCDLATISNASAEDHSSSCNSSTIGDPSTEDHSDSQVVQQQSVASETPMDVEPGDRSKTTDEPANPCQSSSTQCGSTNHWLTNFMSRTSWFWSLSTPIFLLAAISACPKLVLLWITIVLAKPVCLWSYNHFPTGWKDKLKESLPNVVRDSRFVREFSQGADQGLPFILFMMYLCCIPFALAWIAVHWLRGFSHSSSTGDASSDSFVFAQNNQSTVGHSETNFYHSRAFGVVLFAFFALGIPAFISFAVYENLGIERMMNSTEVSAITLPKSYSFPPAPSTMKIPSFLYPEPKQNEVTSPPVVENPKAHSPRETVLAREKTEGKLEQAPTGGKDTTGNQTNTGTQQGEAENVNEPELQGWTNGTIGPQGDNSTVIQGYNGYWPFLRNTGVEPKKASVFFVHFYLVSLASAISILFFRAWFSFPLNFLTDDHDVEFSESGIKRNNMKSCLLSVLTMNRWAIGGGPDSLQWSEVKSLRQFEEGFAKLTPLPETAFKKESLTYKLLNKLAAFMEGICYRPHAGNFLVFSSSEVPRDFGRSIKINLKGLSRAQRARLFYSVKKWAPHVVIHGGVEQQLLGSTVLKENRYTQLWFDLLTTRTRSRRNNVLPSGEQLKDGEYRIDQRISSGGQATTYLATKTSGEKCVLKEFILATSTAGALIESAREFEAEVGLLSQLNHPGIVRLEDFFSEDGRLYVALEYIEGQSLRQKIQHEGPLSDAEVVRIAQSICAVLEYLHSCNPPIVHRDITPENILIGPNGTIKVIDFSLAVKQDGRQTTDSCAKQAFTPPEQFREEVCVQSDIYALGATMYFLLTGLTPKPISCSSPQKKAEHVSPELNHIVERATQPELSQRYESVHWLKLDLDSLR